MTLLYKVTTGCCSTTRGKYEKRSRTQSSLIASQPRLDWRSHDADPRAGREAATSKPRSSSCRCGDSEEPNLERSGLVYAHAGRREEALGEIARIERLREDGLWDRATNRNHPRHARRTARACAALLKALTDHSQWIAVDADSTRAWIRCAAAVLRRGARSGCTSK